MQRFDRSIHAAGVMSALALGVLALSGVADAEMIRPTFASATTWFSAAYDISHAISGAGLPVDFTPDSPHATYATNNHWTTAANRTIGESATFFFSTPTQIGGFYMWNHRSNGVAVNPNYAVTRFDLVFRDSNGTVLRTIPDLTSEPDIAIAQRYAFDIVHNVNSVEFIVRATRTNNVSPYTGLAEVAFDTCIAVTTPDPQPATVCPGGTVMLSTSPFGSGPITNQWQIELGKPGSDNWLDLVDGPMPKVIGGTATVSGATTPVLSIAGADEAAGRRYRLAMSTPCGDLTTAPATLEVCDADFNCDNAINSQDFFDFLSSFFGGC
jgi:hypothetical protein